MKNKTGAAGEDFAAAYLQQRGCRIVTRNYHSRYGEIDVIAANEVHLIFLEVKARAPGAMVSPLAAVTPQKQRKIIRTAQAYLMRFPTRLQPRFDVMGITMDGNTASVTNYVYLKNAFC
ncbi:MAG: YraN family protein [Oscillospiraceae bacterium]|jgi:putative endonuclease|nr:YraN family protein [Oscillospiraceae bacterium]MDD3261708.1 YraN family protein [Oscillospiraceae bacterium]